MIKITFAAALFAASIHATEVEAEGDKKHAYFVPKKQPYAYPKQEYCDVDGMRHQEHLDTQKYQALPAACKKEIIWDRINSHKSPQRFFTGKDLQQYFDEDINVEYDTISDTLPVGRIKRLFPRGVVTLMEYVPAYGHDYTGIFRGAKHAVQRVCEFSMTTPEVPKSSPGLEIKFLRDGMSSANMVT